MRPRDEREERELEGLKQIGAHEGSLAREGGRGTGQAGEVRLG